MEDLDSGILQLEPAQATKLKGIAADREATRVRVEAMKAFGLPNAAKVTSEITLDETTGKNGKISLTAMPMRSLLQCRKVMYLLLPES